jgi:hypothetical protein
VSIAAEAHSLRKIAEAGPIGKRHSSFELYDLLGKCMKLAERCAATSEYEEMRGLVTQQPGANRRYVERGSDRFILVCRFVFSNLRSAGTERSNASRYAHTLRQAHQKGLRSDDLAEYLKDNGGVNALFLRRPLASLTVTTKCLVLTEAVRIPKDHTLNITLRRTPDNRYEVLDFSTEPAAQAA